MATSAAQPYIAKLGFQDKDRGTDRHGLACEYLFERLLDLEVIPFQLALWKNNLQKEIAWRNAQLSGNYRGIYPASPSELASFREEMPALKSQLEALTLDYTAKELSSHLRVGECINVPVTSRSYVNGFADVLIPLPENRSEYGGTVHRWLGEVKITKEPAENVLQQINFYLSYIDNVKAVYILTDYDPSDLQRLCVGTKIKVFRLGRRFNEWFSCRPDHSTEEL
jgi:hypothetical protein